MKIIPEDIKQKIIIDYKNSNFSVYDIAKKFNVSRPTVITLLRKNQIYVNFVTSVNRRRERIKICKENYLDKIIKNKILLCQIKEEFDKKISIKQIALNHNMQSRIISNIIFKHLKLLKHEENYKNRIKNEVELILKNQELINKIKIAFENRELYSLREFHYQSITKVIRILKWRRKSANELVLIFIEKEKDLCNKIKYDYCEVPMNRKEIRQKYNLRKSFIKRFLILLGINRTAKETQLLKLSKAKFGPCNLYKFNDKLYQGSFELCFAVWLTYNHIEFETHDNIKNFKYFDNENKKHIYFPDFYVWGEYIDIKGFIREKDLNKHNLVMKFNPEYKFRILAYEELAKLGVLSIFGRCGSREYHDKLKEYKIKTLIR